MENVVLKANRYRIVDNSAFELPLPLKFTVWKSEAPVCEYLISEDEEVSYKILTRFKELMITTIHRALDISDIYYMFSCRVFQDRTPYTYPILDRMGIEKYNVYNILRRTHGVTPYDDYWIQFDGETLTFEDATDDFDKYVIEPEAQPIPFASYPSGGVRPQPAKTSGQEADVDSILNQHRLDFNTLVEEANKPVSIAPEHSYEPQHELENNKMSEDEIEALLRKAGIEDDKPAPRTVPDIPVEPSTRSQEEPPSGGTMSQEDVEKMLNAMNFGGDEPSADAPAEEVIEPAEPSGSKMSQDDIEKMLAAAMGADPEPEIIENNAPERPADEPAAEPESVPASSGNSGGKMSQDDIEKLLAANAAPAAEPAPEPEPASSGSSGGKMSQDDIEKLLAANAAPAAEPAPNPETAPASSGSSGGKMSQDDIEKLLAANAAPAAEPAPEPEPAPASSGSSGGKMSQDDIEKLLAANAAPAAEPAPEPEPASSGSSGGKMSQDDIEKLLAANAAPAAEPAPEPEPASSGSSGGKMSQDDIEKLLAANAAPAAEPTPEPEPASSGSSGGKMSQDDIEKLLAANAAPAAEPAPEPKTVPASSGSSGGKMSQSDIEALLNSMQEEATK